MKSELQQRVLRLQQARESLVKAAAATLEIGEGPLIAAIFHTALAMVRLVQCDPEEKARAALERMMQKAGEGHR